MRTPFLAFLYSFLMRGFLKIFIGVKFQNREVLKKTPQFIIVANHNSHVDTMALMSSLPSLKIKKVHPVAAGDYFGKSKIRAFATRLFVNALLIPRSRPVDGKGPDPIQMMLDLLAKGESLILFPEGSRGEAEKLQKFKKGIGILLEKNPHIPFIPVFMKGMGKILPKGEGMIIPFNSLVIFGEPKICLGTTVEEIVKEVEDGILSLQENTPNYIKMRSPEYLQTADKIGIVACARKISLEEIQPAIDILKDWGLDVVLGKNLFNVDNQYSGTDKERAEDLQTMLDDPSIKAIISARGGYGTMRIIDKIDFKQFKKQPKWIVGYSDITVLHSHIHNFKIETLQATMPVNFTKNKEATESLRRGLFGEESIYSMEANPLNKKGKAKGIVVGGNLSLLYALTGSPSDIDTNGKILFIEDLDEYLYHIDRMMINLKRAGKLKHLAGLVVGGMTDMKDNATPFGKTAEEIIIDAVKEYNYPVCFNFPAGHIDRNLAIRFGREAQLKVADTVELVF